ncbi:hypothetical protein [uncultured Thermosynechococcus sp.]|uniref:hypothetical protein n=1 Tax=uncultured Thermosynechococcus sp. TaxID=436945 RepID=UPI002616EC29|nr:hypothetical protein [uncultured Thermosynechococcus sp.]
MFAIPSLPQGSNLTVEVSDRLGIIGNNGSGKTTFILLRAAVPKLQREREQHRMAIAGSLAMPPQWSLEADYV